MTKRFLHFHMCFPLSKNQRWLKLKNLLKDRFSIVVNFSGHSGYHTAFEYVTKEDPEFWTSLNHPRTVQAPRTLDATKAMLEVLAYANSRKLVGDSALYEFVLNRGQKKLSELLKSVWDMQFAREKFE